MMIEADVGTAIKDRSSECQVHVQNSMKDSTFEDVLGHTDSVHLKKQSLAMVDEWDRSRLQPLSFRTEFSEQKVSPGSKQASAAPARVSVKERALLGIQNASSNDGDSSNCSSMGRVATERRTGSAQSSESTAFIGRTGRMPAIARMSSYSRTASVRGRSSSTSLEDDCCMCCCEPLRTRGIGECGHMAVCGLCTLRLRVLMNETACILCQQPLGNVLISSTTANGSTGETLSDPLGSGCWFDDRSVMKEMVQVRQLSCKICAPVEEFESVVSKSRSFVVVFESMAGLAAHLQDEHNKSMCMLCVENRRVFVSEQALYTEFELLQHLEGGGQGESGHPACSLCSPERNFYEHQELAAHLVSSIFVCLYFVCCVHARCPPHRRNFMWLNISLHIW